MISVVIPIYNMEIFLEKCLDSIYRQTYTDIEVIMVDDGSSDSSFSICKKWEEKDSRFRAFHQENRGVCSARNRGMKESRGEYICFIDPDDYIMPEMIDKLQNILTSSDADISFCGYVKDINGELIYDNTVIYHDNIISNTEAIKECYNPQGWFTAVWNKMFKKNMIESIPFPEDLIRSEDEVWLMQVLCNAKKIGCCSEELYVYRQWPGSICAREKNSYFVVNEIYKNMAKGQLRTSMILKENNISDWYKPMMVYIMAATKINAYNYCNGISDDEFKNCFYHYLFQYLNKVRKIDWRYLKVGILRGIMNAYVMARMPKLLIKMIYNKKAS